MAQSSRNAPLELGVLVALSAGLGFAAVIVSLLIGDLVQGRGLNFGALTRAESVGYYALGASGLAGTAVFWYLRRGMERPYRYWDGVLWGVVCYALTATVLLVVSLPSILQDPVLGLMGTLLFVYVVGGLFALPAVFSVAPLALWLWHKVLARLRQ